MNCNAGMVIEREIAFTRGRRSRKQIIPASEAAATEQPVGRVPRIARLVALALRFDQLVCDGEVTNFAEIARVGHVTRARVTQIMNLLNLAPDIIDDILHLPLVTRGKDSISEHDLRPIAAELIWTKQRAMWRDVKDTQLRGSN